MARELEVSKWDITNPFIVEKGYHTRALFGSSESHKGQKVSLLLMLLSYWVKKEMGSEENIQKGMIERICP